MLLLPCVFFILLRGKYAPYNCLCIAAPSFMMFALVLYYLCIVGILRPFFVKKVIRIDNPYNPYGLYGSYGSVICIAFFLKKIVNLFCDLVLKFF